MVRNIGKIHPKFECELYEKEKFSKESELFSLFLFVSCKSELKIFRKVSTEEFPDTLSECSLLLLLTALNKCDEFYIVIL